MDVYLIPCRSCTDCVHHAERETEIDLTNTLTLHFCGHYDLLEIDAHDEGRSIGLVPRVPHWCPMPTARQQALPIRYTESRWKPQGVIGEEPDEKMQRELF